jgi:hypothetical protein
MVAKCTRAFLAIHRKVHIMAEFFQSFLNNPTIDWIIFGDKNTHVIRRG